jgi:hypothetical protein
MSKLVSCTIFILKPVIGGPEDKEVKEVPINVDDYHGVVVGNVIVGDNCSVR